MLKEKENEKKHKNSQPWGGTMENTAKIIVVDDEKIICKNVEKILEKNNFEVHREYIFKS